MTKAKSLFAAAFTVAGLIAGPALHGATCTVPTDHATIQSAVNDAGCETISVLPRLYNENVTINRPVTINGAQAGQAVAGRTSGGPAESFVYGNTAGLAVFTINATDVTIDGFTIRDIVSTGAAYGVIVSGSGSGAAIQNNIFDEIRTDDTSDNATAQAVYLTAGGPDNVTIQDNEMKNVQSKRSAKGVLIGDNGGTNPSQNVEIKGNSIQSISSFGRGAYGVSVANVANVSGLKITSNTINNLSGLFAGGWVHAIGLEGDTPGVEVKDNDISNLNTGNGNGIAVWFESNPSFGTAIVRGNNFNVTPASYGIAVDGTAGPGSVNGTCNWWGNATGPGPAGPGTGAQVGPRVTYLPWLTAPAPSETCGGGLPQPTSAGQCKNGGWRNQFRADGTSFKNQGDCLQYVNTGR